MEATLCNIFDRYCKFPRDISLLLLQLCYGKWPSSIPLTMSGNTTTIYKNCFKATEPNNHTLSVIDVPIKFPSRSVWKFSVFWEETEQLLQPSGTDLVGCSNKLNHYMDYYVRLFVRNETKQRWPICRIAAPNNNPEMVFCTLEFSAQMNAIQYKLKLTTNNIASTSYGLVDLKGKVYVQFEISSKETYLCVHQINACECSV